MIKSLVSKTAFCWMLIIPYLTIANEEIKSKNTIATPEEDDYNVHFVKLDLKATNTSTAIIGFATTKAEVTAASMSVYAFELSNQLTIDSCKVNGAMVSVQRNGAICKVNLSSPLPQHSQMIAEAWYQGQPTGGTGFFSNGLLNAIDITSSVQVTHTVSAAYHSKDWWPCKQSLSDKIDSADIWVTVPSGLKVASNGLLQNVTPISSSENRFEWSHRNMVDYYLLSFAVAPYDEYSYYMHFPNGDSMIIQNFIYQDTSILKQHKDELDSIANLINYFSLLFGKYPFANEKFGICQAPLGGGMENQTMVSLGSLDMGLIAHELAHQWWGNHVTCNSLEDMWLNEGWATYAEHIYAEHFKGKLAAAALRTQFFNQAMGGIAGSVWVNDTTNEFRIYDSRLTYSKGASLCHMLRYMINNDSIFVSVMRNYQQQFGGATASTKDLKALATQLSGVPLDTFFHQWYKGEGYPIYTAKWAQQANGDITFRLFQTTSRPNSVPFFKLPVEIRLNTTQGDTTIRVNHTFSGETFQLHWNQTMTGMTIDPENHIVNKLGTITQDPTLSVDNIFQEAVHIFPNPALDSWNITGIMPLSNLILVNMNGQVLWSNHAGNSAQTIPAIHLAKGIYILRVINKEHTSTYLLSK